MQLKLKDYSILNLQNWWLPLEACNLMQVVFSNYHLHLGSNEEESNEQLARKIEKYIRYDNLTLKNPWGEGGTQDIGVFKVSLGSLELNCESNTDETASCPHYLQVKMNGKKVPRSPGMGNRNLLYFLPIIFTFEQCVSKVVCQLIQKKTSIRPTKNLH